MSNWNIKYRPQTIEELHLQVVRDQLNSFLKEGSVPQSMLFAGPKGTGKTSASRIIGAVLNDPRNKNADTFYDVDKSSELSEKILKGSSFVVQELDAASNRRIDDVRALKDRVSLPPQEGTAAVYILDEAHMLTTEAFNALLKLLEEPPKHAYFILATTELHKIPATIVSRCQVVHFHKASQAELIESLERVLKAEKVEFDQEALELIAQHADGSFRDAIKIAQLVTRDNKLTKSMVEKSSLGTFSSEIKDLLQALISKDEVAIATLFEELRSRSVNSQFFFKRFIDVLHSSLLQSLGVKDGDPIVDQKISQFLLKELSQLDASLASPISHLPLEIKLLDIVSRSGKKGSGGNQKVGKKKVKKVIKSSDSEKIKSSIAIESKDKIKLEKNSSNLIGDGALLCDKWDELVKMVAEKNITISALLRSAQPKGGEIGQAKIGVFYAFHQEQLAQPKIFQMLDSCIQKIAGGSVNLEFMLSEQPNDAELVSNQQTQELAQVASEVLM